MSQMSFSDFEYAGKRKQTRRERFLAEMNQVVPWNGLLALIEPYYPKAGGGRKPYPLETMLRIHLLQNWFSLSDPETKKGNQYFFGMKTHIGADVESGLVHHVHGTAANVADVTQVAELLHGEENAVYADAGYTGVEKREEHQNREVVWQIAARRSTYSKLSKRSVLYKAKRKIEYLKAQTRAKVEHPFRVIKRQFGYVKVRYRGLMKNTTQLTTLFALSNLWMARKKLMVMG
ncbi:IS5 family transposase [Pseudomonas saponiphila]|uniref:IS5 family transposase n=1 Tax=Pseudomonas saponiphila TaxID=556534 RepID=UPI0022409C5C|nr:IS5 family transposase [Pseudomonas saponiphila]